MSRLVIAAQYANFFMTSFNQFNSNYKIALAQGANDGAELLLQDIRTQVPVLTGKLRNSYRIERATPSKLTSVIDGGTSYGAEYYPFIAQFGRRQAALPPTQRLFAAPGSRVRRDLSVRAAVERRIQDTIQKG